MSTGGGRGRVLIGMRGGVDRDEAFREFVATRGPALLRTAYALTGDHHLAEDLLQSALVKAYRAWPRVEADAREAYVRRIVVTTHLSWRRKRANTEVPGLPERPDPVEPVSDARDSALWEALRALPPRQRAVMVLRYYEDLTEVQIAAVLGCSPGAVKTHASRAAARLRELLGEPVPQEGRSHGHR